MSGNCIHGVCCVDSACQGVNRCDILGSEGRCVPPLPEGAGCVTNRDCAIPLLCEPDGFGDRRCAINLPSPTIIPTRSADETDAAGDDFGQIADDGCQLLAEATSSEAAWMLIVVGLFLCVQRAAARVVFRRLP